MSLLEKYIAFLEFEEFCANFSNIITLQCGSYSVAYFLLFLAYK